MALKASKSPFLGRINLFDAVILVALFASIFFAYKFYRFSENPKIPKKFDKGGYVLLEAVSQDLRPEVAALISKGDVVPDDTGKPCIEVLSVIANDSSVRVPNRDVRVLVRAMYYDRFRKRILYVNDAHLLIGSPLSFMTNSYAFNGTIVKVAEDVNKR